MRIPDIANSPQKVQLVRLGHVYFEHADLESFSKFAKEFGFVEAQRGTDRIYYRGYGQDPFIYVAIQSPDGKSRFKGPAFVAKSAAEFEKAAQMPGATSSEMGDAPGGGRIITFQRPDGTLFHIVHGQRERHPDSSQAAAGTHESHGPYNTPFDKPRKGQFQRYHLGPALVSKLGHIGYVSTRFYQEVEWYTSNFNIIPSDVLSSPRDSSVDIGTFMRLDLGKEFSDHHSMFLMLAPPEAKHTQLHHTSYEVADLDDQFMGHQYLAQQGWKSVWGVGRHVLGSQIFDYWYDSSGFKIEHYCDGDLVNRDNPTRRDVAGPLSVWAPEMPSDFGHGFEMPE